MMTATVVNGRPRPHKRIEWTRLVREYENGRTTERHEARIRGRWVAMEPPTTVALPEYVEGPGEWIEFHEARDWDVQFA